VAFEQFRIFLTYKRGSKLNQTEAKLTPVFQKVRGGYIGSVKELPGANTQGRTLRETRANLKEAVALVLDANRTLAEEQ
jgi:predicted RNase H-like HicB family nuclease